MCMPQGCVHALGSLFAKESQLFFFETNRFCVQEHLKQEMLKLSLRSFSARGPKNRKKEITEVKYSTELC